MNQDLNKDALKNLSSISELERTISVGIQGAPELKLEEKLRYLGEFRERVLKLLTKGQIMKNSVYQEIIDALKDKRATKMLLHGDVDYRFRNKYQKIAAQIGKPYTVIHNSQLKGNTGLVIASDQAVDIENILLED